MSEPVPDRETRDASGPQVQTPTAASKPRWVGPLTVAVAVLFVVALVVLHLTGAVGPGAH